MVLHSNTESFRKNQISVLAIIETIIAIAISLWILLDYGYVRHIVIASFIAPLLLTRTDQSSLQTFLAIGKVGSFVLGNIVSLGNRWHAATSAKGLIFACLRLLTLLVVSFVGISLVALCCVVLKIGIGIRNIFERPIDALAVIPNNWRKIVLCTDSMKFPEFIPGTDILVSKLRDGAKDPHLGFLDLETLAKSVFLSGRDTFAKYFVGFLIFSFFLLPALLYRWSLKSTAIVWSPLLWAFKPISGAELPAHFAKGVVSLGFFKASRLYSAFVLFLFLLKACLWWKLLTFQSDEQDAVLRELIARYVVPDQIVTWHVVAAINGVITWIIFFRSEKYIHDLNGGHAISKIRMRRFFQGSFFLRNFLALYVSFCVLYITTSIMVHDLPPLRIIFFPW